MSVGNQIPLASWFEGKVFYHAEWLSNYADTWSRLLAPLRDSAEAVLEIGSLQGRSALFFLNYLPNAQVTCIDPFGMKGLEPTFDYNVTGFEGRVEKIRDLSFPALTRLRQRGRLFDVIYIDGDHHREAVMLDSVLCWPMLRRGGILIWDDYGMYKKDRPMSERPKSAIDGFLTAYAGDYEELHRANQMIVKKTADCPPPKPKPLMWESRPARGALKTIVQKTLRGFGYELHRCRPLAERKAREDWTLGADVPPPIEPIWPLPRVSGGLSDNEIRRAAAQFEPWDCAYQFAGGLSFDLRHTTSRGLADESNRSLQRFRHFMPYLIRAQNGSLRGKRVLDIACNSGFWSVQCALRGADVIGCDARRELIDQANLIKTIVGISNIDFRVMDFWQISPESLGERFDIVLNLGVLCHLSRPLDALELTKTMTREYILLDAQVCPDWMELDDIRNVGAGGVACQRKSSIASLFKQLGVAECVEIPIRTLDMPRDYLEQRRASWLIKVTHA